MSRISLTAGLFFLTATVWLRPSSASEAVVTGLDYPGLRPGAGAVATVSLKSDTSASLEVSLETGDGRQLDSTTIVARAGSASTVPLHIPVLRQPSVLDVLAVIRSSGRILDAYPHRLVFDHPQVADERIRFAPLRTAWGRPISTVRELVDEYAPVLRLSTPGAFGEDEHFAPIPVDVTAAASQLVRRREVPAELVSDSGFDATPLARLGDSPGADQFLDLLGAPLERDSPQQAATFAAEPDATNGVAYATVVESDGALAVQYWMHYLYNDWTNDHEADWEQVTIVFDGFPNTASPTRIAGSRHQDGTWRAWSKAPKLIDDAGRPTQHPVVFVANGGHGNYFWPGDDDAGPLGSDNHDGALTTFVPDGVASRATNWRPLSVTVLPRLSERPTAFRWLAYSGRWGFWDGSTSFLASGSQGPGGPPFRAGAGLTSSRPAGEMWLSPAQWLDQGRDGAPLPLDAEGAGYWNDTPHDLSIALRGSDPTGLGSDAGYRCELLSGTDRLGGPLAPENVAWRMYVDGPGQSIEGSRPETTVHLGRGGAFQVSCFAAEIDPVNGHAYAAAVATRSFSWCPHGNVLEGGQCRCPPGTTSPAPATSPCLRTTSAEQPSGSFPAGCGCTGSGADLLGLLLVVPLLKGRASRGRRRGRDTA